METNATLKAGLWIMNEESLDMQTSESAQPASENEFQNDWHEYFPDFSI